MENVNNEKDGKTKTTTSISIIDPEGEKVLLILFYLMLQLIHQARLLSLDVASALAKIMVV
jgi:hypothetical protein